MRIIIASSCVPFVDGGGRFFIQWMAEKLREHGHDVDHFFLPFEDDPEHMLTQIVAYRLIDLSESCDRLICVRPPAYVLQHPFKIIWFIHHFRAFYDLWDSEYCDVAHNTRNQALRRVLIELDTRAISEARRIYALSQTVAHRLKRFNGIDSTVLYQPLLQPDQFRNTGYGRDIVFVCRMEAHKRQHLLVEAMRYVMTGVRLHICGASFGDEYKKRLLRLIERYGLGDRVILECTWISEERKLSIINGALAVANPAIHEDSFAYASLEGGYAKKAVITTTDAGGVLELVVDGVNGLVVAPHPVDSQRPWIGSILTGIWPQNWVGRPPRASLPLASAGKA